MGVRYAKRQAFGLSQHFCSSCESPHFPGFPLSEVIPKYLEQSKAEGGNKIIKEFRNWLSDNRLGVTEYNPMMILSYSPLHLDELVNRSLNYF